MDCVCHGEPAYWHRFPDRKAGGFWRCAVRKREVQRASAAKKRQQQRDRYDRDPVFRIGRNLKKNARRRANTLKRRRESLGPVSLEGLNRPTLEQHPAQDHTAA